MKIKFVDGNLALVNKVSALGIIEAKHEDYFREARNTKNPVLMTASNPMWTFGHFNMVEVLQDIDGYEGLYQVSNWGFVYSFQNNRWGRTDDLKEITPWVSDTGYKMVTLCDGEKKQKIRVHRLVAEAFIPNRNNEKYINHIDGDKLNNHLENLEWCSLKENNIHAYQTGLRVYQPQSILQYDLDGFLLKEWKDREDIAKEYGLSTKAIYEAIRLKRQLRGTILKFGKRHINTDLIVGSKKKNNNLDYSLAMRFPRECREKQLKGGGNERINNICFCQSVDDEFKSNKEIIKEAFSFAIKNTKEDETLLITGYGLGIGRNPFFDQDTFLEVLKEIIKK